MPNRNDNMLICKKIMSNFGRYPIKHTQIPFFGPEKSVEFFYYMSMDTYRIVTKGLINHHITDLIAGLTITWLENGDTMLIAPIVDQSALRGLLDHLWDFNATIVVVQRIEDE